MSAPTMQDNDPGTFTLSSEEPQTMQSADAQSRHALNYTIQTSSLESVAGSSPQVVSSMSSYSSNPNELPDTDRHYTPSRAKCRCCRKLFGNMLLPGLCGLNSCRLIDPLPITNPISRELIRNTFYYCARLRHFVKTELFPPVHALSVELYFPTGQPEAEELGCISAEMWAATYLMLGLNKHIREQDIHRLRSALTSLAWDSAQTYRATLKFHRSVAAFRGKIIPLWSLIEKISELGLKNRFQAIMGPPQPKKGRKQKKAGLPLPTPLSTIRVHEDFLLQHTLSLHILPEGCTSHNPAEYESFKDVDYDCQIEIIRTLLISPVEALHDAPLIFRHVEARLLTESLACSESAAAPLAPHKKKSSDSFSDPALTFSRALRILAATVKLLFAEVELTPNLHEKVVETLHYLGEELNDFFIYADWVSNKFSAFHSMLRLCYNFSVTCFDLSLPGFESVVKQELGAEDVYALEKRTAANGLMPVPPGDGEGDVAAAASASRLNCEETGLEYKVVSLTKLMMEVSPLPDGKKHVDKDFDWQDFYKTKYHSVLQRLPLKMGDHRLQFVSNPDVQLIISRTDRRAALQDASNDNDTNPIPTVPLLPF